MTHKGTPSDDTDHERFVNRHPHGRWDCWSAVPVPLPNEEPVFVVSLSVWAQMSQDGLKDYLVRGSLACTPIEAGCPLIATTG